MTKIDIEVIQALADCDMNASSAARKMYVHLNTVAYHITKIQKETGLNPRKFRDLVKLLEMVDEAREI